MSATDLETHELLTSSVRSRPMTLAQYVQQFFEMPLIPMAGLLAVFMTSLLNLADLEAENETVGLSGQVLFKLLFLAMGGGYGALGFLYEPKVRRLLTAFPVIWIVIIFGFFCLSVPSSITPTESFASTMSIACIVLMTLTALVQSGVVVVLTTVFHSLTAFVILSWVAVFAAPSIGIFEEPLGGGEFATRMAGLAHPNTLGQFSGLTIVLGMILYSRFGQRTTWRIVVMGLAAGALIGSISRTSILATMIAVMFVYRQSIFQKRYQVHFAMLGLLGAIGLLFLVSTSDVGQMIASKMPFLSKSGDTEELTSATGRSAIWSYAIYLIGEQPWTGYGASTSKYFLSEFSLYTHNMILHIAFSTGVLGGVAAVCMCLGRTIALFTRPHMIADGIVVFVLLNGLFENVIFSILAGLPTLIWTVGLCLPLIWDDRLNCEIDDDANLAFARWQA